ncbi:hypothetical protein CW304_27200 [Bacillus sp. UFRGS-B20]|nr:hypothetical protein CW304_27200 [Bacillus sp. UFRGS-B20]
MCHYFFPPRPCRPGFFSMLSFCLAFLFSIGYLSSTLRAFRFQVVEPLLKMAACFPYACRY